MTEVRTLGPALAPAQLTLPLRLSLVYVVLTVGMYFSGSYAAQDANSWAVGLFMFAVAIMFTLGYWAGVHRTAGQTMIHLEQARGSLSNTAATRLIVVGSVWFLAYSLASLQRVGVTGPMELLRAISHPQASYYAKFDALSSGEGNALYRALNVMGVFYFLTVPLLLLHWGSVRRWVQILALASLGSYLLFYLSTGTQKGVADLLIMFVACALPLRLLQRGVTVPGGSLLGRRAWLTLAVVGLAGAVLVATSLGLRTDDTSAYLKAPQARALYESISPILGGVLGRGFVVLASYASQGYHGLALAFQLPFEPAGGLGAYKAFSLYLPQYFGLADPYLVSYPVRVEETFGWSATGMWSSVYPWYASDVSFAGVILLALVFGFFLARIWRRLMLDCDAFTLSIFVTCVVLVLYSPANNQLFNDRLSAIGVVTLLGLALVRELIAYRTGRHDEASP